MRRAMDILYELGYCFWNISFKFIREHMSIESRKRDNHTAFSRIFIILFAKNSFSRRINVKIPIETKLEIYKIHRKEKTVLK